MKQFVLKNYSNIGEKMKKEEIKKANKGDVTRR